MSIGISADWPSGNRVGRLNEVSLCQAPLVVRWAYRLGM